MNDQTSLVTAFSDAAEFTGVMSRDRGGWLELRKTMLTASDVASVLDLDDSPPNYRRSPLGIYVEKLTDPARDHMDYSPEEIAQLPPLEQKEHLRKLFNDARFWGGVLEQPILTTIARYSGWEYREGGALLKSRRHPWLGATLDSEIRPLLENAWGIGEGKTSVIRSGWDEDSGSLPGHILVQAQSQLLVTGAPYVKVQALLQGSRFVQIPIEPDPEFHQVIVECGEAFMERLRTLDQPPADWRDDGVLDRLYRMEDGAVVDLPEEAHEWTRELLEQIGPELKKLKRRDKQLRCMLKQKLGPASYGILPTVTGDKAAWSWKTNKAGQRVLRAIKRPPTGARLHGRNADPVANDPITEALEKSLDQDDPGLPPARFRTGRKRSNR